MDNLYVTCNILFHPIFEENYFGNAAFKTCSCSVLTSVVLARSHYPAFVIAWVFHFVLSAELGSSSEKDPFLTRAG